MLLSSSPFSLLLQEVGEVVALVHVVRVLALLRVQLVDGAAVALLGEQQLTQHPPVRLLVLLLQALQLRTGKGTLSHTHREMHRHVQGPWTYENCFLIAVVQHAKHFCSSRLLIDVQECHF